MEEEGNKVESQEMEVDGVDEKLTKLEVENFTIKINDNNVVKWYNCNLCSSRFDRKASARKDIMAKHTVKSKPEKPVQNKRKNIKDDNDNVE